jgi:hypothetical protein
VLPARAARGADERQLSGDEAVNEDRRPVATATRVTGDGHFSCVSAWGWFLVAIHGENEKQVDNLTRREASNRMSILWIILIVILVLALLGFFSRGRW